MTRNHHDFGFQAIGPPWQKITKPDFTFQDSDICLFYMRELVEQAQDL